MKVRPTILFSIVILVALISCNNEDDPIEMVWTWTLFDKSMELSIEGQDVQTYYSSHINYSGKTPPQLGQLILENYDTNFANCTSITFKVDGTYNTEMKFKGPGTWSANQYQMTLDEGTADEIIVEILKLTLQESQLEFEILEIADYNEDLENETLMLKFNMNLRR